MHYPPRCFKKILGSVVGGLGTGDWGLGIRDWRLETRDWGLETGDLGLRASGYQSCFASQGFASIYIHLLVTDHIRIF